MNFCVIHELFAILELLFEQTLNGGCGANAYCMPTGPAQTKCFCDENYIGDGYTCSATLRQVITESPFLTTLDTYLNVSHMILFEMIKILLLE